MSETAALHSPYSVKRLRTHLRRVYLLSLFILCTPTDQSLTFGSAFVGIAVLLHFAASGYLTKEEALTTAGPYRWVRNPFYVANFMADFGFAVCAANGIVPILYFPLMYFWVIRRRVLKHEEPNLKMLFGNRYEAYCRDVPRFIPNPFSSPREVHGHFTWHNILENREVSRIANMIVTVPAIYLTWRFKEAGLHIRNFLSDPTNLAIGVPTLALFGLSIVFYLIKRARSR